MKARIRIISASIFSIASILLIGFFGLNSIRRFDESGKWVVHTQQVINEARQILLYCADLETASRGYAITADSEYLEPYHAARANINKSLKRLKKLTRDNAVQAKELLQLQTVIEEKADFCDSINKLCTTEGKMAAQQLISGRRGLKAMASIRQKVGGIIERENNLLRQRSAETDENYTTTYQLILFSLVGSVLILLVTFYLLLRDLHIRSANEKKIRDNEHELKQFFDTIPIGIFIMDKDKKPYYANKSSMELMGIDTLDKVNLQELSNIEHTSGESYQIPDTSLDEAFSQRGDIHRNDLVMKRDGKEIHLSIRSVGVRDSDSKISFVMSIVEDVSLQRKTEQELLRAKKFAEDSDKQKEIFLTNMSHEIRTPMNAIVGFTTLLGDTALTKEQEDYLDSIRIASGNLLHIINDILDLSKIQAGHINFETLDFKPAEILEGLSKVHSPEISSKGLKLAVSLADNVPSYVKGDPLRLRQVLTNLLGNAIKFSDRGTISIQVEKEEENGDELTLAFTVSDQGIGIDADKLPFIFDRFTQADFDTNRLYGGTGLGLNISKSLIEQQNGAISVESRKNEGTTFRFRIPFKKSEIQETSESVSVNKGNKTTAVSSLKILLVEDNMLNQKLALRVMKDFGYHLDTAVNGREALEKLRDNTYDLILMDLQMPELDGYQTTQILRRDFKLTTPIIAMTAHSLAGERDKCLEAGMNDYISKPFKFDQLKMKIDQAIKSAGTAPQQTVQHPGIKKQLEELAILLEKSNLMESKMLIFKLKSQISGIPNIDQTLFSGLEQLIREKAESAALLEEFHSLNATLNQKLRS
ncbi:MAG: hypothetical protein K0R65_2847 [Crocinitomicaceae bacterium]|jgi:PAS domain S-box-containing protein|nr:hypothetical protein [Crocinitomicaceae bacterium]